MAAFIAGKTLAQLQSEFGVQPNRIRAQVIASIGKLAYLRHSHSKGGKKIARKLKCKKYRKQYAAKMSISVRKSLGKLMAMPEFKQRWKRKAIAASRKGTERIAKLLLTDESFFAEWQVKCKRGGITAVKMRRGVFAANADKKRAWSLSGLRNSGRKTTGPKGERMYNELEVEVARALTETNTPYTYERIIHAPNKNGFISVDFSVNKKGQLLFIEATRWNDVKEKGSALGRKFEFLARTYPAAKLVLVTEKKYVTAYGRVLKPAIYITTPTSLKYYLTNVTQS